MFGRLVPIPEEFQVPADGGAVDLSSASNGIAEGLVQELLATITFLGKVETLRANTGKFVGGYFHSDP